MSQLPRVLLVEDDASLRRFVTMALEELALTLVTCSSVAEGLVALNQGSFDLIVTDLMMPGESGFDLLDHLQANPALRGAAKLVVLSAGLTAPVRQRLAAYALWRLIDKPVSVVALEACVTEALADRDLSASTTGAAANPPAANGKTLSAEQQAAVEAYFEGDMELFDAYNQACQEQFPNDLSNGEKSFQNADWKNLRMVAHSLKSVLQTLGHDSMSGEARALEAACVAGDAAAIPAHWPPLRDALSGLVNPA